MTLKITNEWQAKLKWSRELMELRRQEKVFFTVKEYEKAEKCRLHAERLEVIEREES